MLNHALARRGALVLAGRGATALTGSMLSAVGGRTAHAADAAVNIDNFSFTPASLTMKIGTKVVFTNRDDIPHTVVSSTQPPLFKSKAMDTGDSFSIVFDKTETYDYFCGLHPHMKGKVLFN